MLPQEVVDLTETSDFLMSLFDDPHDWRQRLVEQHVFQSAHHMHVTAKYQFEFPPQLVQQHMSEGAQRAKVLLPVTTREKRVLLRFALVGPNGSSAHLLQRASIASLQAETLTRLADSSPGGALVSQGLPGELLEAICVFTPALFRSFDADAERVWRSTERSRVIALSEYLSKGMGLAVSQRDVRAWLRRLDGIAEMLIGSLDEPADPFSSSEHVLLAIPHVDPLPSTRQEITRLVRAYALAVRAAHGAGDEQLLRRLAESGRRWDVIVEVEVPLLEPFGIRLEEDRPLEPHRRGWCWQPMALDDAASVHYEGSLTDHSISMGGPRVRRLDDQLTVGLGPLESVRETPEAVAFYTSVALRPRRVEVGVRVRAARLFRLSTYLSLIATLAGIVATAALDSTDEQLAGELAVIVLPATVTATLVLAREQTSLAARLLARARLTLGLALIVLWAIAVSRFFGVGPAGEWLPDTLDWVGDRIQSALPGSLYAS